MRTRYARYLRDRGQGQYIDIDRLFAVGGVLNGDSGGVGYERKRLDIPAPRIPAAEAGRDLSDVVEDFGQRLDGLRQAGLGAASAGLDEIQEETQMIAAYLRGVLSDFDTLYGRADQLTGDLDVAQRENRRLSGLRENLANQVQTDMGELSTLRRERTLFRQLVSVLREAEQRRTIKRGTVKRWLALAEQRARGRQE